MPISVILGGTLYILPSTSTDAMTQSALAFLAAVSTTPYWQSPNANPALSGYVRLASGDAIAWRNQANNADLLLAKNAADQLTFGGAPITGQPYLEVSSTLGQSIPNNLTTIVLYSTVVTDTDSGYSVGTGRYTVPAGKGGHYLVCAIAQFSAAGAGAVAMQENLYLFQNGVTLSALDFESLNPGTTYAANNCVGGSSIVNAAPGDILDVRAYQNSGGAITLTTANIFNRLVIHRLVT